MYDKILAPIDVTNESAEVILEKSPKIAEKFGAELLILHSVPSSINDEDLQMKEQSLFREKLSELKDKPVQSTVIDKQGDPDNSILDVTESRNVDLIIMTSTNRNKLEKVIMGSVTEKAIEKSNVPVLVL